MRYQDCSREIIGAAMEVHSALGNGFKEVIYQRSLVVAFNDRGLTFEREKTMDIFFKGVKVGTRRVDFFVDNSIMVEIKAVLNLEGAHFAQAINYLEAYKTDIGLLINFGQHSLQFKRLYRTPSRDDKAKAKIK